MLVFGAVAVVALSLVVVYNSIADDDTNGRVGVTELVCVLLAGGVSVGATSDSDGEENTSIFFFFFFSFVCAFSFFFFLFACLFSFFSYSSSCFVSSTVSSPSSCVLSSMFASALSL